MISSHSIRTTAVSLFLSLYHFLYFIYLFLFRFINHYFSEALEGLEVVGLHHGVMGGRGAATGEAEDGEEQDQLGDEGRQVADDALGGADVAGGGVMDELLAAVHEDDRQDDREGEEHPAHEAVALGGAAEDFGGRGRSGAGHGGSDWYLTLPMWQAHHAGQRRPVRQWGICWHGELLRNQFRV